jgi:predicted regulator of Ras-like GTPase activity (Roadblock/LC7/MglB family)
MMVETKKDVLSGILAKLKSGSDVEGAAIITRDGLVVCADMNGSIDSDVFAAMTATMHGAAETAAQELKKSDPDSVIVESKDGKIIILGAGTIAVLACIVSPKAKLGLILLEMKKAVSKIEKEVK